MYKMLLKFTPNVRYICNERGEGHNIYDLVTKSMSNETNLFIALDSSSNDIKTAEFLKSQKIDFLVIDHHQIENENPYATIVNPQQAECPYPNKHACGGLLTYKICELIDEAMGTKYAPSLQTLSGLSLSADMMDMTVLENRYYFKLALEETNNLGIRKLFDKLKKDLTNLKAMDFMFGVSPIITSATRADRIQLAIDFLMSEADNLELEEMAQELLNLNELRKEIQAEAVKRLRPSIDEKNKVIILYDPTIGKGYNGLVAQEITKEFNRPTIILGDDKENENVRAGSMRAPENSNFLSILKSCENTFSCGGHEEAAGASCESKNTLAWQKELNDKLSDYHFDNNQYYILALKDYEVNQQFIEDVEDFYRITGYGFKEGKFLITDLFTEDQPKVMGKLANTMKVNCGDLELLKFKTNTDFINSFPVWQQFEVLGSLNINKYMKFNKAKKKKELEITTQIYIDDYRIKC